WRISTTGTRAAVTAIERSRWHRGMPGPSPLASLTEPNLLWSLAPAPLRRGPMPHRGGGRVETRPLLHQAERLGVRIIGDTACVRDGAFPAVAVRVRILDVKGLRVTQLLDAAAGDLLPSKAFDVDDAFCVRGD